MLCRWVAGCYGVGGGWDPWLLASGDWGIPLTICHSPLTRMVKGEEGGNEK